MSDSGISPQDLDAIRSVHYRRDAVTVESLPWCDECCVDWPCPYAKALAELDVLRGELQAARAALRAWCDWGDAPDGEGFDTNDLLAASWKVLLARGVIGEEPNE